MAQECQALKHPRKGCSPAPCRLASFASIVNPKRRPPWAPHSGPMERTNSEGAYMAWSRETGAAEGKKMVL